MNEAVTFSTEIKKQSLTTREAAQYIGFSVDAMKKSRIQGSLCGERPPKFVRIGKKTIRYLINDLDEWLNQRDRYETIAQEQ